MCEHTCPEKCLGTAEGPCGRGGECYECQAGYYGETCSEQCSSGCPTCVMVDGFVADEDNPGHFLPQGYCNVECTNDNHGPTCVRLTFEGGRIRLRISLLQRALKLLCRGVWVRPGAPSPCVGRPTDASCYEAGLPTVGHVLRSLYKICNHRTYPTIGGHALRL